jgi:hypothetical protein
VSGLVEGGGDLSAGRNWVWCLVRRLSGEGGIYKAERGEYDKIYHREGKMSSFWRVTAKINNKAVKMGKIKKGIENGVVWIKLVGGGVK